MGLLYSYHDEYLIPYKVWATSTRTAVLPVSALKPGCFTLLSEVRTKVVENTNQNLLHTNKWTIEYGRCSSSSFSFVGLLLPFPSSKSHLVNRIKLK